MATYKNELSNAGSSLTCVAEHAGVSAMTVSRVLNQPNKVAEATRQKVEASLDALGYVPNLAANTLRRERSGVIVAMVPTVENSIFSDTIQGISNVLEATGYQLMLGCTSYDQEKEEKLMRAFLGRRPDGIILTGISHTDTMRVLLENSGVPIVEMWDLSDQCSDNCVGFDNYKAGYEIARYMLECGYENIGLVATTLEHEAHEFRAAKRSAGIYAAFRDANRPAPLRRNVSDPLAIDECGATAADFVAANPEFDAIICSSEVLGVGAIKELHGRGWQIPEKISVAGIGDANIAGLVHPGLTTIKIPGKRIGERSAEILVERLRGSHDLAIQEDIGFQLVVRGSTK